MCRNIRMLFNFEPPATDDEIAAAALQYVRKVSGTTAPSEANRPGFDRAVAEITAITRRLVRDDLTTRAEPRSREDEARKAKQRGQAREARTIEKLRRMEATKIPFRD
jgi:hypothetical protein